MFWIVACCAYCSVVVGMTVLCLEQKASVLDRIIGCASPQAAERAVALKEEIRRLILRV